MKKIVVLDKAWNMVGNLHEEDDHTYGYGDGNGKGGLRRTKIAGQIRIVKEDPEVYGGPDIGWCTLQN